MWKRARQMFTGTAVPNPDGSTPKLTRADRDLAAIIAEGNGPTTARNRDGIEQRLSSLQATNDELARVEVSAHSGETTLGSLLLSLRWEARPRAHRVVFVSCSPSENAGY